MKKITFDKIRKPTPEELQRAIEADLIRTTEQTNERLELIWKWKGSGLRALATDGETERLTAVCEKAEHAVYQCEIIERTYQQYKRKQRELTADDWREIISAIRYAELDPSGLETTPDWDWFVNHVLCVAQGLKDEGLKAALQSRCEIISRVKNELTNNPGSKMDEILAIVRDMQADATATALNAAETKDGVAWLVADRQSKMKGNKERGKTNQATGNTEECERAAKDMQTALNRVHDRMKHGAKNVIGECRKVCKEFEPLTTKKNELGKFESYAPLTGVDGEPIKPDTLAKNYRKRFGTKKAKKAKAARTAKPKRRTK